MPGRMPTTFLDACRLIVLVSESDARVPSGTARKPGRLAAAVSAGAPYVVGTAALVVAVVVLLIGRRHLAHLDAHPEPESLDEEASVLTAADS